MSLAWIGVAGFIAFFIFMFLNIPIGITMAVIGFTGLCVIRGLDAGLSVLSIQTFRTGSDYVLGVIPLFVAMGFLAMRLQLSTDLFTCMNKWVGHWRGGLAMASALACTVFGAICGDATATSVAVGVIALPEMRKYKYADILSTGVLASAGNLGLLIPPSLAFIVISMLTEQSIGTLFIAGILPGILLAVLMVGVIWIWCRINPGLAPPSAPSSWGTRFRSTKNILGAGALIILVLGGIYGGLFTPTEAAAIGVFGALIVGLSMRRLTWNSFKAALIDTGELTGKIYMLIIGAMIFMRFVTASEIPLKLSVAITTLNLPPLAMLILVLVILTIMGCFIDLLPVIMITTPILFPTLVGLGYDPLLVSVLIVMTGIVGGITPPVGMVVFAISGMIKDVPVYTIFKGVLPFVGAMLLAIIIMIIFPDIVLVLPNLMKPG
ncbi:MAG: TRAP transporter large permease [Dehalococcoidales bacterium]|nr:TRAP transporter large permease [Dehalococcoidales bacterium]